MNELETALSSATKLADSIKELHSTTELLQELVDDISEQAQINYDKKMSYLEDLVSSLNTTADTLDVNEYIEEHDL